MHVLRPSVHHPLSARLGTPSCPSRVHLTRAPLHLLAGLALLGSALLSSPATAAPNLAPSISASPLSSPAAARPDLTAAPRLRSPATGKASASGPARGVVITSDMSWPMGRVRVIDPVKRSIVYNLDTAWQADELCNRSGVACVPLGIHHVNHGGQDFLDVTVYVANVRPDAPLVPRYSVVNRVRLTKEPQLVWKLRTLDFADVPNGGVYCSQDPYQPAELLTDQGCTPQLVHGIKVIDDRPEDQEVTVLLSDMFNMRALQVTLNYADGNTVGHVDWVLGKALPEWPSFGSLNAVDYVADAPGGPYLLVTFYQTGARPYGGQLWMWQWTGADWQVAWRFPETLDGTQYFINTPHMGEVQVDPRSGQTYVLYAHSRGLAGDWGSIDDQAGTIGFLRAGPTLADQPTYLGDATVYMGTDEELHFTRDSQILSDGSLVLMDSGCENPWGAYDNITKCVHDSRVFRAAPFLEELPATTLPGDYQPDFSHQNIYPVQDLDVKDDVQCGFVTLFQSDWVDTAALGNDLLEAAATTKLHCPPARE